jgi:hypothetical protein
MDRAGRRMHSQDPRGFGSCGAGASDQVQLTYVLVLSWTCGVNPTLGLGGARTGSSSSRRSGGVGAAIHPSVAVNFGLRGNAYVRDMDPFSRGPTA